MKRLFRLLMFAGMLAFAACSNYEDTVLPGNTGGGDQPGNKEPETPTEESVVAQPDAWDGTKRADVSYQLLVYSFADSNGDGIGDLKGIADKLDYLDELGVSALWLSPLHPAMSYHGYDVLDYEAINPEYGTEADFKNLIDAAHSHGIKIYMDWVINHTGKEHPWFKAALADENSPYRKYYILSTNPQADIAAGRIDMIATEGASGYDSGQWFSVVSGSTDMLKAKFTLKWGTTPTLTIEKVDTIENSGTEATDRFLYYGDGEMKRFYSQGDNVYTLSLEFTSSWGCLVRTSESSWDDGYKWGASASNNRLQWGVPMNLVGKNSAADILLPDMEKLMYHSHFWTDWFADLNYGKADTCETSPAFTAICNAAKKWIDLGIDGLRLDGAKHIYHNAASDENHLFWGKMFNELNSYFQSKGHSEKFYMVGEVFDDYQAAAPYFKGLPSIFDFGFWYRLKWAVQNSTGCYLASDITKQFDLYASFRNDYIASTKLTNHDENRAKSDLGDSDEKAKIAGAVLLTSGGHPYIYYGEELGYVGIKDGKGDEYVRNPLKWGDSYTTTFIKQAESAMSKVSDIAAQSADEGSMLNVYKHFSQLRNTYPALAVGTMTPHPTFSGNATSYKSIAAWYMQTDNQKMLVLHNLSSAVKSLPVTDELDKAVGVLGSVSESVTADGKVTVKIGAWSTVVYLLK